MSISFLHACNDPNNRPKYDHASFGVPAELPDDWPIQELTLPVGAMQDLWPDYESRQQGREDHISRMPSADGEGTSIGIAFDCAMTWEELSEHVKRSLSGSDFQEVEERPLQSYLGGYSASSYYSTDDGKTTVLVGFIGRIPTQVQDYTEVYYYLVFTSE